LRELWINWNNLADTPVNRDYLKRLHLRTIYLADNPISMGDDYQKMLTEAIPSLKQIDGNLLNAGLPFHHQKTAGIHSVMKKEINPQAKQILQQVLNQK
jgi:nitrate reductase NapAB chaperone NapD